MLKQVLILPILHISENGSTINMLGECLLERLNVICQELKIEYDRNQLEQHIHSLSFSMTFFHVYICFFLLYIFRVILLILFGAKGTEGFLKLLFFAVFALTSEISVKNFTDSYKLWIRKSQTEFPSINPIISWILWITHWIMDIRLIRIIISVVLVLYLGEIIFIAMQYLLFILTENNESLRIGFIILNGLNHLEGRDEINGQKKEYIRRKWENVNVETKSDFLQILEEELEKGQFFINDKTKYINNYIKDCLGKEEQDEEKKIKDYIAKYVKLNIILFICYFLRLTTMWWICYYLYSMEKLIKTIMKIETSFNDKNLDSKEIIKTILYNF